MRCPNCGLVHSHLEAVCRRCEIDLKTGENRTRAGERPAPALEPGKPGRSIRRVLRPAAAPALAKAEAPPRPVPKEPKRESAKRRDEDSSPVIEVLSSAPDATSDDGTARPELGASFGPLREIGCVQCGARMTARKQLPFSPKWPPALVGVGVGLLILGLILKAYLVWIVAVAAVVAGVVYGRLGKTFWKCDACGFVVPRA